MLRLTERGLYCEAADCYIDPWPQVPHVLITLAHRQRSSHSDDARPVDFFLHPHREGDGFVIGGESGEAGAFGRRDAKTTQRELAGARFGMCGNRPAVRRVVKAVNPDVWISRRGEFRTIVRAVSGAMMVGCTGEN